jgi:hypothetical protein
MVDVSSQLWAGLNWGINQDHVNFKAFTLPSISKSHDFSHPTKKAKKIEINQVSKIPHNA